MSPSPKPFLKPSNSTRATIEAEDTTSAAEDKDVTLPEDTLVPLPAIRGKLKHAVLNKTNFGIQCKMRVFKTETCYETKGLINIAPAL